MTTSKIYTCIFCDGSESEQGMEMVVEIVVVVVVVMRLMVMMVVIVVMGW